FKGMIRKYLENDDEDEEMTAEVMEAILKRRLSKKHEETDDELMDELELRRISKKREETDDELMDELELRRLSKKHEETDDELMDDFELRPIDNASDAKIGSGFEEAFETDDEIEDLCNDKLVWTPHPRGVFTIATAYEVPREDGHKQQWWKQLPQNIPKHAFITWMTWQAALTTLDKLVDWRYYLTQTRHEP
ncbi:hypothetical protein FRX31_024070, partial [Thalictrum thalictroides]